jgi:predicted SprT family Zn-dependent metalloprotease
MDANTPTISAYSEWQTAYDFFNDRLFHGKLPDCLISLDTKNANTLGYFAPERFVSASGEDTTDILSMNPQHFLRRSLMDTLSTLVHEMCHVWQHHHGDKKSQRTYHNREWGDKMESLGLMPSNTGKPGGKKTGQQMTHYIIEGGPFETQCKELLANNFKISWADRFIPIEFLIPKPGGEPGKGGDPTGKPPAKNKHKYKCTECGATVWGKPDLNIICGHCQRAFDR